MHRKLYLLLMLGMLTSFHFESQAQVQYAPTEAELKMLPLGCQARLGSDKAAYKSWEARFGHDIWIHMHHYCNGLKEINRAALAIDRSVRRKTLGLASREFDYVLQRWPTTSPMFAEAQQKKKEVEQLLSSP